MKLKDNQIVLTMWHVPRDDYGNWPDYLKGFYIVNKREGY